MPNILIRSARTRGWVVLTGLLILAVAILWGLVIFVWSVLAGTGQGSETGGRPAVSPNITATAPPSSSSPSTSSSAEAALEAAKNALAAKPMLPVAPAAALPQPIAASAAGSTAGPPVVLPAATDTTGLVPTGYPRTPAGAVAQLAAIDALALKDLNPSNPRAAYDWAALPGAVPFEQWTPQVGVSAILTAAGTPRGSSELTSTWALTHAQIKGVLDDGNFVLACVLGQFDANYRSSVRAGVGDCQRMVWQAGRWWIGPGTQPAFAPSTWPGSADCMRAGWREVANA
ncbi:MAG: hypothetical protein M3537_11610 [Chloroflexota bacterium]|nr:hypothetical protein [Chloroflexota bacterium]